MTRAISAAIVTLTLICGGSAAIHPAAAQTGMPKPEVSHPPKAANATDVRARHRYRPNAHHLSYRPYYYARPSYYRPYPYDTPAPFIFGFGFGPRW